MKTTKKIPIQLKRKVQSRMLECRTILKKYYYAKYLPIPEIEYALKGSKAGMAYDNFLIDLNPDLFLKNKKEFIKQIVPHEYAHIVQHTLNNESKPHGKEWKTIMRQLNLKPITYHELKS